MFNNSISENVITEQRCSMQESRHHLDFNLYKILLLA
jgi:hypothetical protein